MRHCRRISAWLSDGVAVSVRAAVTVAVAFAFADGSSSDVAGTAGQRETGGEHDGGGAGAHGVPPQWRVMVRRIVPVGTDGVGGDG
jgi:hypothetical protein